MVDLEFGECRRGVIFMNLTGDAPKLLHKVPLGGNRTHPAKLDPIMTACTVQHANLVFFDISPPQRRRCASESIQWATFGLILESDTILLLDNITTVLIFLHGQNKFGSVCPSHVV